MTEPPRNNIHEAGQTDPATTSREMIDLLIAISVVARHLARKLEKGESDHE